MAEQNISPTDKQQTDEKKADTPFEKVSKKTTTIGSILRVLEERYTNLRRKMQMTDQNLLEFEKDMRSEIKALGNDLLELKRSVSEINENLIMMSSELKNSVKQYDFKVIEKYVDMWQPMNFVTREELKHYVEKSKN